MAFALHGSEHVIDYPQMIHSAPTHFLLERLLISCARWTADTNGHLLKALSARYDAAQRCVRKFLDKEIGLVSHWKVTTMRIG